MVKQWIKKIKNNKVHALILCITGIIITPIILFIMSYDHKNNAQHSILTFLCKSTWGCVVKSNENPILIDLSNATRSNTYLIFASDEENKRFRDECFVTTWHAIHFIGHLILGFIFPMFILEIFIATALFEVYEYYSAGCHDILDIVYNASGLLIGASIARLACKHHTTEDM